MSFSLLPERHPVRDFFVLDILDVTPRSDIASMAHPIFSLSTRPETRILRYQQEDTIVEIHPSTKGLATIYDKDVLIYCISKLMHRKNNGEAIGPVVRITTHDLLVSTNRNTGGISYERLEDTLDRLAGTRIKTNVVDRGRDIDAKFRDHRVVRLQSQGQRVRRTAQISRHQAVGLAVPGDRRRRGTADQPGLFSHPAADRPAHL